MGQETRAIAREIDVPLAFITQIDLATCPIESELDVPLPKSGLLSYFIDTQEIHEFAPGLGGGSLLVWHPPSMALVRQAPPTGARVFPEVRLVPKPLMTFHDDLGLSKSWSRTEMDTVADWNASEPEGVQLGGFAHVIQNAMEPQCESGMRRLAGEVDTIDWKNYKGETWDWKLVLQVDASKTYGMTGGRFFVWMREADIRDGKFENAGTIVQFM